MFIFDNKYWLSNMIVNLYRLNSDNSKFYLLSHPKVSVVAIQNIRNIMASKVKIKLSRIDIILLY